MTKTITCVFRGNSDNLHRIFVHQSEAKKYCEENKEYQWESTECKEHKWKYYTIGIIDVGKTIEVCDCGMAKID